MVLTGVIGQDEEVWTTIKIPQPLLSATFPFCLSPPTHAEVLVIHDVLNMETGTCMVCLENKSTCRLVCGEPENAAIESSSGCKGSQVCVLCKTQMCLMTKPIDTESSTYFIVPLQLQEV